MSLQEIAHGETKPVTGLETEEDLESGELTLFSMSARIKTLEEAMSHAKIDTRIWTPVKVKVNSWEMGSKVEGVDVKGRKFSRGVAVTPLFQVSVELKRKTGREPEAFRASLVKSLAAVSPKKPKPKYQSLGKLCCEVSIADHHFGKLAWHRETSEDYDISIAEKRYRNAIDDMVHAMHYTLADEPQKILFILGNDFLHVDRGGTNQTTRGTQVDSDGRWQKAFEAGVLCLTDAILKLREIAPVHCLVVPGNHDEERMFTVGHVMKGRFHNDKAVTIDNEPRKRKAFNWGVCFIGFEHGQNCNTEKRRLQLPNLYGTDPEFSEAYAKAKWREIHLGHLHKEREDWHKHSNMEGATVVRTLPSLCGTDAWHYDSGYRSLPAAEMHLWDKKIGSRGNLKVMPRG